MNAIISGRAGLALITEGTSTRTLRIDEAGEISEVCLAFPDFLLRDVEDLEVFRNVTMEWARQLLAWARQREDALHMILILLNDCSSATLRAEAAAVLDGLLRDNAAIEESVERILYAAPLPPSADVAAALRACKETHSLQASAMISNLDTRQSYIADVRRRWDSLATFFMSSEEYLRFQAVLVAEGFFRELVECLASDMDLVGFVASLLSNDRVMRQKHYSAAIHEWVAKWHGERRPVSAGRGRERRYTLECVFVETKVLSRGISESERERLYFDLMRGRGKYIPGTRGLKRIRCGPYGCHGRKGHEVVFAEYRYPDIGKRIFLLLVKFSPPVDSTLTKEEKKVLRPLKAKADRYIERFCEGLQDEESGS